MCLDNSGFVEAIFFQVKGRWVIMQNLSNQGWFKTSFMSSLKRFYFLLLLGVKVYPLSTITL